MIKLKKTTTPNTLKTTDLTFTQFKDLSPDTKKIIINNSSKEYTNYVNNSKS